MGLPTIAAVINTYKRPRSLLRVLRCLSEQLHTHMNELTVTIVNDGSHEHGYQDQYDTYPFKVQYFARDRSDGDLPRLYGCKNFGVAQSAGDVLWLLDDDLYFDEHTLVTLRIYHMLMERDRPVVIPHYADASEPHWYQEQISTLIQYPNDGELRHCTSFAGLSLWRADWNRVGGLDEAYDGSMGFCDQDLGLRLYADGCTVALVDGVTCFIDDSESLGSWRSKILSTQPDHPNGALFQSKYPNRVK